VKRTIIALLLGVVIGVFGHEAVQITAASSTSTPLQQAEALSTDATSLEALSARVKQEAAAVVESFKPTAPTLRVGINGLAGWGPAHEQEVKRVTGVSRDRVDGTPLAEGKPGAEQAVVELLGRGITPLLVYNPTVNGVRMHGLAKTRLQTEVLRIAAFMHAHALDLLEFGNEVYEVGQVLQPGEYAEKYGWAREVTRPLGITLIADAWVNTYDGVQKQWSYVESGGGWCKLFTVALGSPPDAWAFHPYGLHSASGFGDASGPHGWETVPRLMAFARQYGYSAPMYLTEFGWPTWEGSDHVPAVSEATQASYVAEAVRDAIRWEVRGIWLFGDVEEPPGGSGGYGVWHRVGGAIGTAKPAAAAYGEAILSLGAAATSSRGP
jgi:hypothetical protein